MILLWRKPFLVPLNKLGIFPGWIDRFLVVEDHLHANVSGNNSRNNPAKRGKINGFGLN